MGSSLPCPGPPQPRPPRPWERGGRGGSLTFALALVLDLQLGLLFTPGLEQRTLIAVGLAIQATDGAFPGDVGAIGRADAAGFVLLVHPAFLPGPAVHVLARLCQLERGGSDAAAGPGRRQVRGSRRRRRRRRGGPCARAHAAAAAPQGPRRLPPSPGEVGEGGGGRAGQGASPQTQLSLSPRAWGVVVAGFPRHTWRAAAPGPPPTLFCVKSVQQARLRPAPGPGDGKGTRWGGRRRRRRRETEEDGLRLGGEEGGSGGEGAHLYRGCSWGRPR